jgi:hypothetical protein
MYFLFTVSVSYLVEPWLLLDPPCTYQPLADLALDTLESWLKNHFEELEPQLPEIVPYLNDYLAEVDTSGGDQLPGAEGDEVAERSTGDVTRTQAKRQREARARDMQVGQPVGFQGHGSFRERKSQVRTSGVFNEEGG